LEAELKLQQLSRNDFIQQITKYGYTIEQMPECFTSNKFAEKLDNLLPFVSINVDDRKYATATYNFIHK
jgi:hypothetical protein